MGVEHPQGIWVPGDSLAELAVSSARASRAKPGTSSSVPDLTGPPEAALTKAEADLRPQKAVRIPDPLFLVARFELYGSRRTSPIPAIGLGMSLSPAPLESQNRARSKRRKPLAIPGRPGAYRKPARASNRRRNRHRRSTALHGVRGTLGPLPEANPPRFRTREADGHHLRLSAGAARRCSIWRRQSRNDNDIRLATAQAMADSAAAAMPRLAARNALSMKQMPAEPPSANRYRPHRAIISGKHALLTEACAPSSRLLELLACTAGCKEDKQDNRSEPGPKVDGGEDHACSRRMRRKKAPSPSRRPTRKRPRPSPA